jgi:hypothetical protein
MRGGAQDHAATCRAATCPAEKGVESERWRWVAACGCSQNERLICVSHIKGLVEAVALMGHLRSRSQRDCNLRPYDPPSAPQLERDHAGTHQVIARAAHAHETHTEYWRRRGGRWVRVERSALAGASARQGEHGRARLDGAGAKTRDFLTTIVRSQIPHEVWPTTNME